MERVKIIGKCPLCGEVVALYRVTFEERVLLCRGLHCDFPFGYEQVQYVTHYSQLKESACNIAMGPYVVQNAVSSPFSATSSSISTADWSDLERLNRVYDSEDSTATATSRASFTGDAVKMHKEKRKADKQIQKNLDCIKKLNDELNHLHNMDNSMMSLPGCSGTQQREPDFGMGELKININTVPNNDGFINIEIINEENESENKKDCGETQENKSQEENHTEKKTTPADTEQANTFEPMNTESNIQETKEENQINNDDDDNTIVNNSTGAIKKTTIKKNKHVNATTEAGTSTIKNKLNLSPTTKELSDLMNSFNESEFMNYFKDQDNNMMNNPKESNGKVEIPKKRNKHQKGKKTQEQPPRRSSRLSKK